MKRSQFNIYQLIFVALAILLFASCYEKKNFDGYLYPIRENGLYGYIDSVGNRIIEPKFLWVSTFRDGLALAVVDTIYREVLDSMAVEVGDRDSLINLFRMYVKYGYIDKRGKFAIKPTFVTYVTMPEKGFIVNDMTDCRSVLSRYAFHSRRALFCDTITWKNGYINNKGEIVIEPRYYYSDSFSEGLAVVWDAVAEPLYTNKACLTPSKLRCAYLDTLGNPVTEFKYESLTKFRSGRGIGKYKKIKKEEINFEDTTFTYETYSTPQLLINKAGEEIKELNFNFDYYGFSNDGISVSSDGIFIRSIVGKENMSYYFIDNNGDFLKPLKGLSDYQLDSLGKCDDIMQVLPDDVSILAATYFNDGLAGISPDKKHWFVIDRYLLVHGYGEESVFEKFYVFNNGLAAVKKKGKWGYINRKIKEQIPCKYDSCGLAYPFLEEIFEYDIQGNVTKVAYINRNDSLVWESKIPKPVEIDNNYSNKEKKNYGKWTYKYDPILDYMPYWLSGVIGVLLFVVIVICAVLLIKARAKKIAPDVALKTTLQTENVESRTILQTNNDEIEEPHYFPSVGQYAETIKLAAKSPEEYFDKLSNLRPVLDDTGEPVMSSGNFAVVFKMVDERGKYYAVRCFHRDQKGRGRSYKLICEELDKVSSSYLLPIKYLDKELFVDSDEYPVLLMDWVEGQTLDKYLRKVIDNEKSLRNLVDNFRRLAIWLLDQPFAHGDLKPDNILVKENGALVLVDYDGMYVPAMEGQKARELGSPDFRNPVRSETGFDKNIDIFPIISILLSLELLIENKDYLLRFGAEDRLLFSEEDYRNIENSKIYKIASVSYKDDVVDLAELLKKQLMCVEIDNDTLKSVICGDNWKKNLYANDIIEKPSRVFYIIYTIALFLFPFTMRSAGWHLLDISFIMLLTNIGLYVLLNIVDLFRPYKKYHINVGRDGSFGCIGTIAVFIPVLLMTDIVSEKMINQSKYFSFLDLPLYQGEWYITLIIWIVWYCSFMIYGQIVDGPYELRLKYFPTAKERMEEMKEREKERTRSEIRKEEKRLQKKKEAEEQNRRSMYDDLPF